MKEEKELYVPLRNYFFNNDELTPGELRTLALLLSQREDYIIYENITASQLNVSVRTMERRFKRLLDLGYLKKEFKIESNIYKKNFDWVITNKGKKYKAVGGQKYYTRFKKSFLLDNNINDFDWAVLSVMLCNHKNFKNYASTIRKELNIPTDKRSKLTKSIDRLIKSGLVFKNYDEEGKLFYSVDDVVWGYIIVIDRTKYETKEEQQENKLNNVMRIVYRDEFKKQKKEIESKLIEVSTIYEEE